MSSMRALVQKEVGDSSTFELRLVPAPTEIPSGHVLLRVCAAALNPVDLVRGFIVKDEQFPVVIGYDVAGFVVRVGSDVRNLRVGERVFGDMIVDSLGRKYDVGGSIAEQCVCRADLLSRIPNNVSFEDAAALPVACMTSVQALQAAHAKQGDFIFISGGSGGVGSHLIQIAKTWIKASSVATTASTSKLNTVQRLGADIVVDYRTQDPSVQLSHWADIAVDCTRQTDMCKNILKQGRGPVVSIAEFAKQDVLSFQLQPTAERIGIVAQLLKDGLLKPVVDTVFPFEDAVKAVEYQASGRAVGKVVIKL